LKFEIRNDDAAAADNQVRPLRARVYIESGYRLMKGQRVPDPGSVESDLKWIAIDARPNRGAVMDEFESCAHGTCATVEPALN